MTGRSPFDIPLATYRLQFHSAFTFDHASEIVPYLAELGISHVYASPFFKARAKSAHGYDIVDHNQLNPELGTRADFDRLCARLRAHGMGLIADIVPNHMGIGKADNPWWLDVLEWGPLSPYAGYFDIDWKPPRATLADKVLLPILGQVYGAALSAGEIDLRLDPAEGSVSFWYFDHRLPLSPRDYPEVLESLSADDEPEGRPLRDTLDLLREVTQALTPASIAAARTAAEMVKRELAIAAQDGRLARSIAVAIESWRGKPGEADSFLRLHELLQRQSYRLAYWRVASDEINYRRFFDISDLAGIRMEDEEVFQATHRLLGELFAVGAIHGVRIDHVDGLADPEEYCRKLGTFIGQKVPRDSDGPVHQPYILVEKVLAHHERLREKWPVSGTTGYDYLALANGLFIDGTALARTEGIWRGFSGFGAEFAEELYRCRRLVIDNFLTSELALLTNLLVQITEPDWFTRDFTRQRLRSAIAETVAAFPVYRTYVAMRGLEEADIRDIVWAIEQAKKRWAGTDVEILDFLRSVLTLDITKTRPAHFETCRDLILRFVARFQQYTGAVAAKAMEDTLFYRYIPLLSANEVGSDPRYAATSLEAFHQSIAARARHFPYAMLASETHDTKRAEDVRARLNILSELTGDWARRAARWRLLNRYKLVELDEGPAPTPNDEYLIYQTVLGTWPTEITTFAAAGNRLGDYLERLKSYVIKACREAKVTTSWTAPNERYENALVTFIDRIFAPSSPNPFLESVLRIAPRIALLGAQNSLGQLVLKATVPGVPDFYQGSEVWDLSLVDPDNRRVVDFAWRSRALGELPGMTLGIAKARWRDGLVKLWVTQALLSLRKQLPELFREGSYQRLAVDGDAQDNIVAFSRRLGEVEVAVLVGRLLARRIGTERVSFWPNADFLRGSVVHGTVNRHFVDVLSGAPANTGAAGFALEQVLHALPVAVLRSA